MVPYEIIAKKRDGLALTRQEINFFIENYCRDEIPDYQMSALCMATYFQGMTPLETSFLTEAMLNSGETLDLSSLPQIKVDKHSTGGVGDKVSLPLLGIVAACGVPVPMIAGRGLGHTGGTLDKMEAIGGFNVNLTTKEFFSQLKNIGCALMGQTETIAPADKRIYALRDVTATVPSLPLITSSIMSKKLAEGADRFVFDIKFGAGAFMQEEEKALELAQALLDTAENFGKKTYAFLTNMEQPLGKKIGNWLEVEESIAILQGKGPRDLKIITHLLAATMLYLGEKVPSIEKGLEASLQAVESGQAWQKFLQMVERQGGDISVLKDPSSYPPAKVLTEVRAPSTGYLHQINSLILGRLNVFLGGGRAKKGDAIDPVVGLEIFHKVGDAVKKGELLARIFLSDEKQKEEAIDRCLQAFDLRQAPCAPLPLIKTLITKNGKEEITPLLSFLEKLIPSETGGE